MNYIKFIDEGDDEVWYAEAAIIGFMREDEGTWNLLISEIDEWIVVQENQWLLDHAK